MTKQEEIRVGRAEIIIKKLIATTNLESPEINNLASELNKEIEDYEHSQGVVIKVDDKKIKEDIGYVEVEPLIGDK